MMLLLDFPSIVRKYSPFFEGCFSADGYEHFKKAISGFIVSDNKTLDAINRLFHNGQRDQSSFNRFFNRQSFDLEKVNQSRLGMLQQNEGTRFKPNGVLSVDNSLLKHYGKHFDNIYYHYDYVHKCHRWAHDLVTLHYSDDRTDYPVRFQLWEPPDWEAVATFLKDRGLKINDAKWESRHREPQKWRNYMRSRYKDGSKRFPEVVDLYETKNHIAAGLIREFCRQHPGLDFPIALDTGFTSAALCGTIEKEFGRDYVGALREDQCVSKAADEPPVQLKELLAGLRLRHADPAQPPVFQKTAFSFKGEEKCSYTYCANYHVNGFHKKQRLVISFLNKELSDRPSFTVTNRLNWYPSGIQRIRRHRWPVETFHQEGKEEGLEEYQVRNDKAIQTYIALIVVAYSMLKCTVHDRELLSSIQQRLQTETDSTLPCLRRLMKAESLMSLIEFILTMNNQGQSLEQIFKATARSIAYQ